MRMFKEEIHRSNTEVKKQNAQRKEDQIEMEFRALKWSSILCTSIRSLAHERAFTCKRGIMSLSTYCHKIYRLFVDYLGLLRRLSTRPVTNEPWLLPQRSMVYSSTFVSTLVILKPYSRVGRFAALKLRAEIIWFESQPDYWTSQSPSSYPQSFQVYLSKTLYRLTLHFSW